MKRLPAALRRELRTRLAECSVEALASELALHSGAPLSSPAPISLARGSNTLFFRITPKIALIPPGLLKSFKVS